MTREEQVDWLCRLRSALDNEFISTPWNKEFTEALTGILEQESSSDATKFKEDVLDAISRIGLRKSDTKEVQTVAECLRAVEALPPDSPEPKMGHWIIYDVHGHKACKYSECDMDVGYPCNDKYCKYCGIKMEEIAQ